MDKCPFRDAQCSAVLPELFCLFMNGTSNGSVSSEEAEEEERWERREFTRPRCPFAAA